MSRPNRGTLDGALDGLSPIEVDLRLKEHPPPPPEVRGDLPGFEDGMLLGWDQEVDPSDYGAGSSTVTLWTPYTFLAGDIGKTFIFASPEPANGTPGLQGYLPAASPGPGWNVTVTNASSFPVTIPAQEVRTTGNISGTAVSSMPTNYGIYDGMTVLGPNVAPGTVVFGVGALSAVGAGSVTLSTAGTTSSGSLLIFRGFPLNPQGKTEPDGYPDGYHWLIIAPGESYLIQFDGAEYTSYLLNAENDYVPAGTPTWWGCFFQPQTYTPVANSESSQYVGGTGESQPTTTVNTATSSDGINWSSIKRQAVFNADTIVRGANTYHPWTRDPCVLKSPVPNPNGERRWWMICSTGAWSAFGPFTTPWGAGTGTAFISSNPPQCSDCKLGVFYSDDLVNWTQVPSWQFTTFAATLFAYPNWISGHTYSPLQVVMDPVSAGGDGNAYIFAPPTNTTGSGTTRPSADTGHALWWRFEQLIACQGLVWGRSTMASWIGAPQAPDGSYEAIYVGVNLDDWRTDSAISAANGVPTSSPGNGLKTWYFQLFFGPGTISIANAPLNNNVNASGGPLGTDQWTYTSGGTITGLQTNAAFYSVYPDTPNIFDPTTGLWHIVSGWQYGTYGTPPYFGGHAVGLFGPTNIANYVNVRLTQNVFSADGGWVVRLNRPTAAGNVWRFYGCTIPDGVADHQWLYYVESPDLYNWTTPAQPVLLDGQHLFYDSESGTYQFGERGTVRYHADGGGNWGYDPDGYRALANYWQSQGSGGASDQYLLRAAQM